VSVTATGFTANVSYTVRFAGAIVANGYTSTSSFSSSFTVPSYPRGSHGITVITDSDDSNIAYYTVTPTIFLSTRSGYVGDSVVVTGTGFAASSTVTIYFGTAAMTTASTTTSGTFSNATFTVPESYRGSHQVKGTDTGGDSPNVSFTTQPKIVVSPLSGTVGGQITVGGTGFAASSVLTIYIDDEIEHTTQTNSVGTFANTTLTIPESRQGSHTVKARDASANQATASFTVSPVIAIDPTSGTSGNEVTIGGTGFRPNTVITVSFNAVAIATTPSPVTSNSKGSFSASFPIPAASGGTHQISASDGTNSDSESLSILSSFSLNPVSGFVGSKITVSGTGFLPSKQIVITFHNKQIVTAVSDSYGRFNASFNVPAHPAGTYTVAATDLTNVQEASFTISTSAEISHTSGYVGMELAISGVGFTVGETVTISYDDNQVATAIVNTNGSFSTNFDIPASSGGEHTIIATDTINTIQLDFTMESTPPATPVPLTPEMDIKTKAEAYFDWEDVTDLSGVTYTLQIATDEDFSQASIVLEETGITQSEYTIAREDRLKSVSKEAPYYWHVKAVDGASNESQWSGTGSFYVGFTLALSQPVIYIIIGVCALLFSIFTFWLGRKTAYY